MKRLPERMCSPPATTTEGMCSPLTCCAYLARLACLIPLQFLVIRVKAAIYGPRPPRQARLEDSVLGCFTIRFSRFGRFPHPPHLTHNTSPPYTRRSTSRDRAPHLGFSLLSWLAQEAASLSLTLTRACVRKRTWWRALARTSRTRSWCCLRREKATHASHACCCPDLDCPWHGRSRGDFSEGMERDDGERQGSEGHTTRKEEMFTMLGWALSSLSPPIYSYFYGYTANCTRMYLCRCPVGGYSTVAQVRVDCAHRLEVVYSLPH